MGVVFKIGAADAGRAAPTAISQRWPGWPCCGFILLLVIMGAVGLLFGRADGIFAGAVGVERVGTDAVPADSSRPPPSFSPQDTNRETQATVTTVTKYLMVQSLVPVKIHNNLNIAKRDAPRIPRNGEE